MIRINYLPNTIIGNNGVIYLHDKDIKRSPCGQIKRMAMFRCPICGKEFCSYVDSVRRGLVIGCGCTTGKSHLISLKKDDVVGNYAIRFHADIPRENCQPRKALFVCRCGNIFEAFVSNVKKGNTRSCGCIDNRCGWSQTQWNNFIKSHNKIEATVYVIRMYDDYEDFIKVGLTSVPVKKRFGNKFFMPCNYEVLTEIKTDAEFAFKIERALHKYLIEYKYKPSLIFEGSTECFYIEAISDLNKLFKLNNMPLIPNIR
jgi:hypothetical protein